MSAGILYFTDFCAEAGVEQCDLCGEYGECQMRSVDEPGHWQPVCAECTDQMGQEG